MNIKTQYLLEASLETLHFETKEWIEEIRFWYDELRILIELVDRKIAHNNLEDQMHKDLLLNVTSMVNRLNDQNLKDVLDHERYLASLFLLKDKVNDGAYRERHKKIAQDMIKLKINVRSLRKQVLDFLERKEFGLRHEF